MTARKFLPSLLAAWLLSVSGCGIAAPQPPEPPSVVEGMWGVYPYELRPDGSLINGLMPVDPMEHH